MRAPFTDARIERAYQSTHTAMSVATVCAFPQSMSDRPSDYRFRAFNLLTVPLGAAVLADAACETVADTVMFPFDCAISAHRRKGAAGSESDAAVSAAGLE